MGPLSRPEILGFPQSDFKNFEGFTPDDDRLRAVPFSRSIWSRQIHRAPETLEAYEIIELAIGCIATLGSMSGL
jgi:hypothetical protein